MRRKIVWLLVSCLMIVALVLPSCAPAVVEDESQVLEEENKALVRRFYEEMNKGNVAVVDVLFAAEYALHLPGGVEVRGRVGMKQYLRYALTVWPDLHVTIEDIVAEGDKVVTRLTYTGTHKGELDGIAPTGKQVTWTGIIISRLVGGKIVEEWEEGDYLGIMQQLGVIPSQ